MTTQQKHTPGLLEVIGPSKPNGCERSIDYGLLDSSGNLIIETFGIVDEKEFRPSEANAFWIKACWNAFEEAGISNPEEFVKAAKELLEASKNGLKSIDETGDYMDQPELTSFSLAIDRAEAAFGGGE